jgi:hypothetical protein
VGDPPALWLISQPSLGEKHDPFGRKSVPFYFESEKIMKKWFQRKNIFIKFLIIGWTSILLIVLPSFLIMSYFFNKAELADRIHAMTDSIIIQMLNARIAEKNLILRDLQNESFYSAGISSNLQVHQRYTENAQEKIGYLIQWQPANEKKSADRLIYATGL